MSDPASISATVAPSPAGSRAATTALLSTMMFLQFFVWGAWYVSMTGWMDVQNLKGLTGWAYTVGPIAAVISPFFLGLIADRFFPTQRVLAVMHLLGGAVLLGVPGVVASLDPATPLTFLHPFVLMLLAHMLCYMPTLGLTNTLCFHHMSSPEKQFPLVRVFGTIGWIVGGIVVGGNLNTWGIDLAWIDGGDKSPVQFYVAGAAGLLLGLFSFFLPHTPAPGAGKHTSIRQILGLDSLKLLAQPSYLVFAVCSFLVCIPLAGYYAYARTFVDGVGSHHVPPGGTPFNATLTMQYGQMSEIIFMLLMPLFFARLGVKWMLAVGMLAWVVRYALFAGAADNYILSMAIFGVVLHGICYDFFFVTGFIYVDRKAPKEIRGQAQGFLVLLTQGLGLGLGAILFSNLVDFYTTQSPGAPDVRNWKMIWIIPALFAAVVMFLFIALFRDRRPTVDSPG
ncbi:MAG: MFS transporter [Phycisphaerales bacterium]